MNKILYYFDHLIFDEYRMDPKAMGAYRIVFSIFIIFVLGIPDFRFLSQYPDLIFQPPLLSFGQFLNGFPPGYIIIFFSSLLIILHFCVLFGLFTRFCSIALTITYIFLFTIKFSFGKIDHAWMITIWIPLLMGIAGWGSEYSIDKSIRKSTPAVAGWPIFLLASILAFGMFTAGLPKLMGDWLSFDTQAVKYHFISNYFMRDRQDLLAPFFLNIQSKLIWESLDYLGVLFELGFILLLWNKRLFSWYIIIAIIFHIMNLLMLNIKFTENFPIYLLFLPYALKYNNKTTIKWTSFKFLFISIGSFFLYFVLWYFYNIQLTIYDISNNIGFNPYMTSLIIMLIILIWYVYAIIRHNYGKKGTDKN
ncbi:HTTM domain-containing protein [Algoriphagus halophytocola]|uniref:HTTM domain-containing protein n=1 Tax=Algoriphagus halophytocola TaxID=2991499 RepID=A0ABY6ML11_9BACT|nr:MULTISPECIES: HTTM domain-containing protein [unclassified Algoriphagus]UZD24441.1 HTTM domain-containing protein [Algoriphagus sp. TR-M5]WBL41805.1 HTTM domain-containing protein [Algoriphagus sp. TR-M9]